MRPRTSCSTKGLTTLRVCSAPVATRQIQIGLAIRVPFHKTSTAARQGLTETLC